MASVNNKSKDILVDIEDLEAGDIIEFERAGGLYFHCGIYDGNGGVIHRSADPRYGSRAAFDSNSLFTKFWIESNKAEIRKDDLRLVAGSSSVYRTNMFDETLRQRSGQEILKWAEQHIGEKGYNAMSKNCQHFCTEGRYGTPINMQVETVLGLRTGFSYNQNRVEVNIVKLPEMSFQPLQPNSTESKGNPYEFVAPDVPQPKTKLLSSHPHTTESKSNSNVYVSPDLTQQKAVISSSRSHLPKRKEIFHEYFAPDSSQHNTNLSSSYSHATDSKGNPNSIDAQHVSQQNTKLSFCRPQVLNSLLRGICPIYGGPCICKWNLNW